MSTLLSVLGDVAASIRSIGDAATLSASKVAKAARSIEQTRAEAERPESTSAMTKAEGGAVNTKALAQAMTSKRGR